MWETSDERIGNRQLRAVRKVRIIEVRIVNETHYPLPSSPLRHHATIILGKKSFYY